VQRTHNTSRFFVENRSIAWVVLVAVVLWGVYGYINMPKRKDRSSPIFPVKLASGYGASPRASVPDDFLHRHRGLIKP
jgi:multidrug efflux pump subunit AcrB